MTLIQSYCLHLCLGHVSEDAGFAVAAVCQTDSSSLHQKHPDHLHSDRRVWLLGRKLEWELWLSLNLVDNHTVCTPGIPLASDAVGFKRTMKGPLCLFSEMCSSFDRKKSQTKNTESSQNTGIENLCLIHNPG